LKHSPSELLWLVRRPVLKTIELSRWWYLRKLVNRFETMFRLTFLRWNHTTLRDTLLLWMLRLRLLFIHLNLFVVFSEEFHVLCWNELLMWVLLWNCWFCVCSMFIHLSLRFPRILAILTCFSMPLSGWIHLKNSHWFNSL